MSQRLFQRTRDLLTAAGLSVEDAQCSPESFGSWYITVATTPRRRIVWDGKDGWLYVQQQEEELRSSGSSSAGTETWDDLWIARDQADQTPEIAVAKLRELVA